MKIKKIESRRGSEDGFTVKRYHAGGVYEVAHSLAASFIRNGWAVEHQEEPRTCGICGKGESPMATTYHLPSCPKASEAA